MSDVSWLILKQIFRKLAQAVGNRLMNCVELVACEIVTKDRSSTKALHHNIQ